MAHTSSFNLIAVVASEPTTYKADEWNLIEKNYLLVRYH